MTKVNLTTAKIRFLAGFEIPVSIQQKMRFMPIQKKKRIAVKTVLKYFESASVREISRAMVAERWWSPSKV
jgi:hypothetical protein